MIDMASYMKTETPPSRAESGGALDPDDDDPDDELLEEALLRFRERLSSPPARERGLSSDGRRRSFERTCDRAPTAFIKALVAAVLVALVVALIAAAHVAVVAAARVAVVVAAARVASSRRRASRSSSRRRASPAARRRGGARRGRRRGGARRDLRRGGGARRGGLRRRGVGARARRVVVAAARVAARHLGGARPDLHPSDARHGRHLGGGRRGRHPRAARSSCDSCTRDSPFKLAASSSSRFAGPFSCSRSRRLSSFSRRRASSSRWRLFLLTRRYPLLSALLLELPGRSSPPRRNRHRCRTPASCAPSRRPSASPRRGSLCPQPPRPTRCAVARAPPSTSPRSRAPSTRAPPWPRATRAP